MRSTMPAAISLTLALAACTPSTPEQGTTLARAPAGSTAKSSEDATTKPDRGTPPAKTAGPVEPDGASDPALTVSGTYSYRTDEMSLDMIGKRVCFEPDDASRATLPVHRHGSPSRSFCFRESDAVARQLGFTLDSRPGACGVQGPATVEIAGYRLGAPDSDEADQATLLAVRTAGRPSDVACEGPTS